MISKKYVIRINGDKWHYSVLDDEKYDNLYGSDSEGITLFDKKSIVFKKTSFCFTTVIHELVHAYHHKLCLSDTQSIGTSDFEEISATFIETHILNILRDAIKIFTKYKSDSEHILNELTLIIKKIHTLGYMN